MTRTMRTRAGFTLIELLVVISIIAVLAALTSAAVMRVRARGKEVTVQTEIRELETSVNAFKSKMNGAVPPAFGDYTNAAANPNRAFRLRSRYDGSQGANTTTTCQEWQFLTRAFPGLSELNTGLPNLDLDCNQSLVFFLTGGTVTGYSGFSTDISRPFLNSTAAPQRKPSFFDIPHNRLDANGRYMDPWGTPYLYITPIDGKQYAPPAASGADMFITRGTFLTTFLPSGQGGVNPYRIQVNASTTKHMKDNSFQIISAGPNKLFGPGGIWTAGTAPYNEGGAGGDDYSNFNNGKLSVSNNN